MKPQANTEVRWLCHRTRWCRGFVFPFYTEITGKGIVKKGFKGGSSDFFEAWGRVKEGF